MLSQRGSAAFRGAANGNKTMILMRAAAEPLVFRHRRTQQNNRGFVAFVA